jgi:ATP-binding cassette, subfamily B, bacterial
VSAVRRAARSIRLLMSPGVRGSPQSFAITVVFQIAVGLALALYPYALRLFVDGALRRSQSELVVAVIFAAVLWVLSWSIGVLVVVLGSRLTQKTDLYLTCKIAELVNSAPTLEHFERPDYLRELDLLNQNRRMLAAAPQQITNLLSIVARVAVVVILLATVNPIFVLLPLLAFVPGFASSLAARLRQRSDDELVEKIRLANELFRLSATAAPAKELRIYNLAGELGSRHHQLAREIIARTSRASLLGSIAEAIARALFAAGFVGVIALSVVEAIHGRATPGKVLMVVLLAQNLQTQVGQLTGGAGQLGRAKKTAERYMWLEDHARIAARRLGAEPVPRRLHKGITFAHVSFSYPGSEALVLDDVSFEIPAGASVALVGENGAGKTTVTKLLARMYEPNDGQIWIDTQDLAEISREDWRESLTATFQDFVRFQLVTRETVGLGDLPRVDEEGAVLAALERSGGSDVLRQLGEHPLDVQLGRSFAEGRELSGGQWQKLALGRGGMRATPLLVILDEPTASLDAATEHAIFAHHVESSRRAAASDGTITLLVSHRFSTVRMADLIIVLDRGRVVERGSHEALMARKGRYAELFGIQERAYLTVEGDGEELKPSVEGSDAS